MWIELVKEDHTQYRKYNPETKEEVLVGTDDRRTINYITVVRFSFDLNSIAASYFFDDDKLSVKSTERLNSEHKPSFEELGKQVPQLRESLERCVKSILQPAVVNHQQAI
ncbi:MAG: hypothetical protein Q8R37_05130 [Nanoarchaeota archaeon]|nr:hypothetical protein [Nanoarchaeota archaeon]